MPAMLIPIAGLLVIVAIILRGGAKNRSLSESTTDSNTKTKAIMPQDVATEERPVLYLNIIIHDGSEVIKAKVKKKIESSKKIPKPIKATVANHGSKLASNLVSPSMIAENMGNKMCKKIPKKMKSKGITVEMKEVFRQGPYVVLQLQVQHVDMITVEKSMKQQDDDEDDDDDFSDDDDDDDDDDTLSTNSESTNTVAGALLQWTYTLIGTKNQAKLEGKLLPSKIQEKLEGGLQDMLSSKFEDQKLIAETKVMKEANQARYFYSKLKEVEEMLEEKKKKKTNPIKEIKNKIMKGPKGKSKKSDNGDNDDDDDDDGV